MKNTFAIVVFSFAMLLAASCHDHADQHGHTHGLNVDDHVDDLANDNTNSVSLTAEQMQSIDLQMGRIENRNLAGGFRANGFLKVPNQNRATVTSFYSGVVSKLFIMPGSIVKKGEAIAAIVNPRFIPMQEEYLDLGAKVVLAETNFVRQQVLVKGNAGALKNLQASEAELQSLLIRQASLEEQLRLMGISTSDLHFENLVTQILVKTPISGSVSHVMVNLGAHVDAELPIAEVVDNSQLHLDLFVFEKDLPLVHKKQSIDFILTNQPGKSYTAEVFSVGTTFEVETKAIAVHCIVKGDKQGLIEGMSVTAQLNTANAKVSALPSEAIVSHDGIDFVFMQSNVVLEDEDMHEAVQEDKTSSGKTESAETVFQKIPIKKGTSEFGYTEVTLLAEVPAGAQFVTRGAFFLMAKMTNAGEAHSH